MKTVEETIRGLVDAGAALQIYFPGADPLTFLLAKLVLVDGGTPKRLKWCAVYPTDQHHVHSTKYTTVALAAGGRDVVFTDGGQMIAYMTPIVESNLGDGARNLHDAWVNTLSVVGNQKQFDDFFFHC